MATCECLTECPFFNDVMANMPAAAEMMKMMYCCDDNTKCARYMVLNALGKGKIPPTLFPNEVEAALRTIQSARVGNAEDECRRASAAAGAGA